MRVAVVGAGIVGVSCALHLRHAGHDVTLLDPRPPGTATSFGNAGGIEVRWNGKVLAPLGTRGQVLTIRITPQDFEIVPPPPKQEL